MTPQETAALQLLLSQLTQIRGISKDPDADRLIAQAVAQQPDAAYLLVQRAMLLEQALETAKARIAQLESQSRTSSSNAGSGFLDANAWGNAASHGNASATSVTGRPLPEYAPQYPHSSAPAFGRTGGAGFLGGGGGSMLGTLAATAAGVAGGAFLFQGIGNLLDQQRGDNGADNAAAAAAEPSAAAADTPASDGPLADNMFEDNSFDGTADGGSVDEV